MNEQQEMYPEPAARGSHIKRTDFHGAGAYARCSYCGRYSDNPDSLNKDNLRCDCGKLHGWSGSFKPPTADSLWSGTAPPPRSLPATSANQDKAYLDWLDAVADGGCATFGVEVDGGIYLNVEGIGEEPAEYRNMTDVRQAIKTAIAAMDTVITVDTSPAKGETTHPTALADRQDGIRYRAWRDALIGESEHFVTLMRKFLPDDGSDRNPTSDEWDSAIDATIAQRKSEAK